MNYDWALRVLKDCGKGQCQLKAAPRRDTYIIPGLTNWRPVQQFRPAITHGDIYVVCYADYCGHCHKLLDELKRVDEMTVAYGIKQPDTVLTLCMDKPSSEQEMLLVDHVTAVVELQEPAGQIPHYPYVIKWAGKVANDRAMEVNLLDHVHRLQLEPTSNINCLKQLFAGSTPRQVRVPHPIAVDVGSELVDKINMLLNTYKQNSAHHQAGMSDWRPVFHTA